MSNVTKDLLSQFYGYGTVPKSERGFSSSEALKEISEFNENVDAVSSDARSLDTVFLLEKNDQSEKLDIQESFCQFSNDRLSSRFLKSPYVLNLKDSKEEKNADLDTYKTILEQHFVTNTNEIKDYENPTTNISTEPKYSVLDTVAKATINQEHENRDEENTNILAKTSNQQMVGVSKEIASNLKKIWNKKTKKDGKSVSSANACAKCNGIFLDLNNFGLSEFPVDSLHKISGIRMLYLDSNRLKEIPHELFVILQCLKWFDVRNNELVTLPSSIKGHPTLETLLIQENKFERLPLEIGLVPNLRTLQAGYNPLVYPPKEILALDCSQILTFLRNEWNKQHPSEAVELKLFESDFMKRKSSLNACYHSNSQQKCSKFTASKPSLPKISVRKRSWNYKPSNRFELSRFSVALNEQQKTKMERKKKIMIKRGKEIQQILDVDNVHKWRHDRSSFDRSMSKAASRTSADVPYAIDVHSYPFLKAHSARQKTKNTRPKPEIVNRKNINEKMNELVESLSQLSMAPPGGPLTANHEQKYLQDEIKKITKLQSKLQKLRSVNDIIIAPNEMLDVPTKKYVPPPAIII